MIQAKQNYSRLTPNGSLVQTKNNIMEFNLKVRRIIEKDWEFLPDWWTGHKGWDDHMDRSWIPENGLGGFIVCKDDYPIAATWLYLTNSKLACINPFVSDPTYRDTDRDEAIKLLIDFTTTFAGDLGFTTLWGHTESPTLAEKYKESGWMVNPSFECNKNI